MKIIKEKGIGSQCQECSRSNIPVLQIIKSAYIIRYCQRCLREAFQDMPRSSNERKIMLKNKAYWQVYNQKRKDYLTLKKRESRAKLKALSTTLLIQDLVSTTIPEKVVDLQTVVDLAGVVDRASKVVDYNCSSVVDRQKVVDNNPKQVVDNPILTQLTQSWKNNTNYSCPPTCAYSYCNNCWYFYQNELINYKEVSM